MRKSSSSLGKHASMKMYLSDLIGGNYEEKDLIDLGLLKKDLRKRLLNHLGRFLPC